MSVFLCLTLLVGVLGGMSAAFQSPLASMIGQRLGMLESIFIVHIGGAVAVLLPLLARGGGKLSQAASLPWYALIAGIFGLGIVGAVNFCIPRVGVAVTLVTVVAGQLVLGMLLDHFGLLGVEIRPFDLRRLAGLLAVFAGTWLILR